MDVQKCTSPGCDGELAIVYRECSKCHREEGKLGWEIIRHDLAELHEDIKQLKAGFEELFAYRVQAQIGLGPPYESSLENKEEHNGS